MTKVEKKKVAEKPESFVVCKGSGTEICQGIGDVLSFVTIGKREMQMVGTIKKICPNGVLVLKNTALVLKENSLAVMPGEYHVHVTDIKRYYKGKEYFFSILSK